MGQRRYWGAGAARRRGGLPRTRPRPLSPRQAPSGLVPRQQHASAPLRLARPSCTPAWMACPLLSSGLASQPHSPGQHRALRALPPLQPEPAQGAPPTAPGRPAHSPPALLDLMRLPRLVLPLGFPARPRRLTCDPPSGSSPASRLSHPQLPGDQCDSGPARSWTRPGLHGRQPRPRRPGSLPPPPTRGFVSAAVSGGIATVA